MNYTNYTSVICVVNILIYCFLLYFICSCKNISTMSNDILFSSISISELEALIQKTIERALNSNHQVQDETKEVFLNISEAAAFLNLSVTTLYSKVCKKELPVMKRGKRLYFSNKELEAYLKAGRKETKEQAMSSAINCLIVK